MEKDIRILIDLYFGGKTTIQQEKELKAYFERSDIQEDLAAYRPLFSGLQLLSEEQFPSTIELPKKSNHTAWWAVAAVVAAIFTGVFVSTPTTTLTEQDARMSYLEFKENLLLVSAHLNAGTNKLSHLETFDQTTTQYLKKE